MIEVLTMGELLVEIMRPAENMPLNKEGVFKGPYPSGAPAIFIDTVARLGHGCAIIGGVGKDKFGECVIDRLKKDGVDCRYITESNANSTGVAFVTYFTDGSREFIFHMNDSAAVESKAPNINDMTDLKYFHIMGCSLFASPLFAKEILKIMRQVLKKNVKISFDPNIRKELMKNSSSFEIVSEIVANTSIYMPGLEELLMISGEKDVGEAVKKHFSNPMLDALVLKNGSKGCCVYTRDENVVIPAYSIEPVDATGAGDCFDGAFISGLCEDRLYTTAARMATSAGALNASAFGPMEGAISRSAIGEMIGINLT